MTRRILIAYLLCVTVAQAAPAATAAPPETDLKDISGAPSDLYPVHYAPPPPRNRPLRGSGGSRLKTTTPPPAWDFVAGTSGIEQASGSAYCNGFVYTVGRTSSGFAGAHQGLIDAFITKHNAVTGSLVWSEQFGSSADDYATGIAIHECTGAKAAIYVTGYTRGVLPGTNREDTNKGNFDIFVRKYDSEKTLKWSRQRGSAQDDLAYSIAVNNANGDVYVTGTTKGAFASSRSSTDDDVFVARYLADGTSSNTVQVGSSVGKGDVARGVAVDRNGKVYIVGYTSGVFPGVTAMGGFDIFLLKYASTLDTPPEWIRQVGTASADYAYGLATSRNSSGSIEVYVVGETLGSLTEASSGTLGGGTLVNKGQYDGIILQFSDDGTLKRATLKGTSGNDLMKSIASDGGANVYVAGSTSYDMDSPTQTSGSDDAFLLKYDNKLNLKSTHQYDTDPADNELHSHEDNITSVCTDKQSGVYLAGFTNGKATNLPGDSSSNLLLLRYADGCAVDPAMETVCRTATGCGDPHLSTADRYNYDFQGVGEFVLAESLPQATQPFSVQVRQMAWGSTVVAVYSAVAARFGTQRVGIYARANNALLVDGAPVPLVPDDVLPLADGTRVMRLSNTRYVISSAQGDKVIVDNYTSHIDLSLSLSPSRMGQVRGLLGNFNNIRDDDFALRNGVTLTPPLSFAQLYKSSPNFADSWRITQSESLFDYSQGENTATFTNASLPTVPVSSSNLTPAQQQNAQQTCRAAGVVDPTQLDGCILDVGLTGNPIFATSAAAAQAQQPVPQQVYPAHSDGGSGNAIWSTETTSTSPSGSRTFLGEFGNEGIGLTLGSDLLPAHSQIIVSFDLFILQAWDGNGTFGPAYFGLKVDGLEQYRTTFSNTSSPQFYPDQVGGGAHPARTGAVARNTLYYPDGDSIYELSIPLQHSAKTLTLEFFADGLPGITNETWGIDRVRVKAK